MKRVLLAACLLVATSAVTWANQSQVAAKKPATAKVDMKAEMMKCAVCKNLGAHWDEVAPIHAEVVKLDNGVAIMHSVSPAKAATYHKAGAEMKAAGAACMTMTDEQ